MPKRLICPAAHILAWAEYSEPALAADQVRVQAEFGAAKHGTEMSFYEGYGLVRGRYDGERQLFVPRAPDDDPYPGTVGNMLVGRVIEAGPEVRRLGVGDRVCLYSGFRETAVAREADCWLMPEGMSWRSAVCLDPADFAVGAVRDGHVRVGDAVAVVGLGAIGLVAVQVARLAGADPVIGLDLLPGRRAIAERLGADVTIDPAACDAGLAIRDAAARCGAGRGADVVLEYSGATAAVQTALRGVAYGGTVVLGAYPPAYGPGLDFGAEAHHNVPNIVFSRACSQPDRDYPRWDNDRIYARAWRLLCEGRISGDLIVDPVVPFEQLIDVYPRIPDHPEEYLKLGASF